eukprot:m.3606 g.3606  ORF g.3606 m.3606 type:complete len:128 (+) comp2794_c0_seq1:242-625(+)
MDESTYHVLTCYVGSGEGLDVGEAVNSDGWHYKYEGNVRNHKPNGIGVRMYENGNVEYGHFRDGRYDGGDIIINTAKGPKLFATWENGGFKQLAPFDTSNTRHASVLSRVCLYECVDMCIMRIMCLG